jgi:hypothetical protein
VGSSPMSDGNFGLSIGAAWWNLPGCCVLFAEDLKVLKVFK